MDKLKNLKSRWSTIRNRMTKSSGLAGNSVQWKWFQAADAAFNSG
jgi:hypothetical protein